VQGEHKCKFFLQFVEPQPTLNIIKGRVSRAKMQILCKPNAKKSDFFAEAQPKLNSKLNLFAIF
jgi:hypothetical protein